MISLEEYKKIISELLDELPEAFFQKLSGGVIVSEAAAGETTCIHWESIRSIPASDRL